VTRRPGSDRTGRNRSWAAANGPCPGWTSDHRSGFGAEQSRTRPRESRVLEAHQLEIAWGVDKGVSPAETQIKVFGQSLPRWMPTAWMMEWHRRGSVCGGGLAGAAIQGRRSVRTEAPWSSPSRRYNEIQRDMIATVVWACPERRASNQPSMRSRRHGFLLTEETTRRRRARAANPGRPGHSRQPEPPGAQRRASLEQQLLSRWPKLICSSVALRCAPGGSGCRE